MAKTKNDEIKELLIKKKHYALNVKSTVIKYQQ